MNDSRCTKNFNMMSTVDSYPMFISYAFEFAVQICQFSYTVKLTPLLKKKCLRTTENNS